MATTLDCPICERTLGTNESLEVGYDARGKLVVWHLVPATVDYRRGDESLEDFRARVASAAKPAGPNGSRHCCGSAGFSGITITR